MCHMWTAPSLQEFFNDFDRIACVHMSGLLVRSHFNAGQDGFRVVGSKQGGGYIGPLAHTGYPTSRIDRSHHLQVSCKFTYRPSTVASLSCSPWPADFFTLHKPRLVAQQCFRMPRPTPSFSTRSWRSYWPTRRLRVSAACRRSHVARAAEGADLRRKCSRQTSSNGRDAD